MDDIFWITGSVIEKSLDALAEALRPVGLNPAWVECLHWLSDSAAPDAASPAGRFPLVFRWQQQGLLDNFLLHDACRAISLREVNLTLLAEEEKERLHFAVLGSPQAVGRYNLLPRAHIAAWWSLPPTGVPGLPNRLEKSGFDQASVGWIAGDAALIEQGNLAFPGAQLISDSPASAIGRLNEIIHRLEAKKSSHGLLLAGQVSGPLLATLVER